METLWEILEEAFDSNDKCKILGIAADYIKDDVFLYTILWLKKLKRFPRKIVSRKSKIQFDVKFNKEESFRNILSDITKNPPPINISIDRIIKERIKEERNKFNKERPRVVEETTIYGFDDSLK